MRRVVSNRRKSRHERQAQHSRNRPPTDTTSNSNVAVLERTDDAAEVAEQKIEALLDQGLEGPKHTYKNLADGVANDPRFVSVLADPSVGHQAVAEQYPFTSESSVRRYRKAQGIEVTR